jgi:hypothetical protein
MSTDRPSQRAPNLFRRDFAKWQVPSEFIARVDEWPSHLVVKTRFLQEAWILAEFAKRLEVERLRLSDPAERWPDAYVQIDGTVKSVEITGVMEPSRRRDDELKQEGTWIRLDPVEDWVARAEAIRGALSARLKQKAAKRYASPTMLLVYLNISIGFLRPDEHETEKLIAEVKAQHISAFEQIVVLWREELY